MSGADCVLCREDGGEVLWRDEHLRIVAVDDADYPGFVRVIWNAHVREMTDLSGPDRRRCLDVVLRVEQVLRDRFSPDKINLAQFGNVVPHVHWHVIPRWRDDPHFPNPVWGVKQREATRDLGAWRPVMREALERAMPLFGQGDAGG